MNIVIVAIPSADDYVWKISSEKVPHLTLCFLGDNIAGPKLTQIEDFLQHVTETSMHRFGLNVSHRGTLGPDKADVVFFDSYNIKMLKDIRGYLLAEPAIADAYNSVDQYPAWTPHLTLGYPTAPAKPDPRDYPGISWVNFDRIALWVDDYTGPEFQLKDQFEDLSMGEAATAEVLKHHGIKGMKWGVKRTEVQLSADKAEADAAAARIVKGNTSNLSNKELQSVVTRMNLEQQYSRLKPPSKSPAVTTVKIGYGAVKTLLSVGKVANEIIQFRNSPAGKFLREHLGSKGD